MSTLQLNDAGTPIRVTVADQNSAAVDVSGANTITFLLARPDGTVLTRTGAFVSSGKDGKVQYVTQAGELSLAGSWRVQVYLALGTANWRTSIGSFNVLANLA